jgi:hypothetical protein
MNWKVWYKINPTFREDRELTIQKLVTESHVMLRQIEADNMDHVFRLMQGEIWSPNGEARDLIQKMGLHHTSMSVGDVIECVECGDFHQVANYGFIPVPSYIDE